MKKPIILTVFLASSAFCGEVLVFAAANTTYAFDELIDKFKAMSPQTQIKLTLGASGGLSTQIANGAKADIFMAANMGFVDKIYKDGLAQTKPVVYARGKLALFSLERVDLSKGLEGLKSAKSISIANPKTAPYGTASIEALKNAGLLQELSPKIIYTQKISQTLSQALSAADVGFIAASALYSPKMIAKGYKQGLNYAFVDPSLYTPIDQGIVLLKQGKDNAEARAFYEFILSQPARQTFEKFGYALPELKQK